MALAVHMGTEDQATKPSGFAPPPEGSGIYKAIIKQGDIKTWDDGSKPPMMSLGCRCTHTASGEETTGWVEWFAFSVAPNKEEAFSKYRPGEQKWKFRNLVTGLGQSVILDKMSASGKTQIEMDPANWIDRPVFVEVRVFEDEYKGEKRMKGRIEKFLTAEQVAEAIGATSESEDKGLEEAAADDAAAAEGNAIPADETPTL